MSIATSTLTCMLGGWPKCHGETMTLDSPEEQAAFDAQKVVEET